MKKIFLFVLVWGIIAGSASLFSQVLMQDRVAYDNMNNLFSERKSAFGERIPEMFSLIEKTESPELVEAIKFLIAYAPLSDLANLEPAYFQNMAALALRTRSEFSWGKSIPVEEFMHFVLPFRVNNENPDEARAVFLPELKERVQGMSMYDAALEVNHWCHEKVAYRSTDERTSSPLATVKTAYGRCGEESTFTVAAMRSVGIPARQVYTPRWAHTDDNHAWVEVWIDGKWYFMGACEPDPELNMGWFSGPATRAIMVHTNTFGRYNGSEKTLVQKPLFSKLNLLSNYAPVKNAEVKVVDTDGKPIEGIMVDYQVYNYSEFFTFASLKTDKDGRCSIETAFGDLMIWVNDGKNYTWKMFPAEQESVLEIVFDPYAIQKDSSVFAFQILPPSLGKTVTPTTSKKEENDRRLKEEDSIRATYENTFPDTASLREQYKNDQFSEAIVNFILKSRGNYSEIASFYEQAEEKVYAIDLLTVISEKDLRDTPASILLDHLRGSVKFPRNKCPEEFFTQYVLSPRIGRELLSSWCSELQNSFSKKEIKSFRKSPENLVAWINSNIKPDEENNYYGVTLFPGSVMKLRTADEYSRNVFFVACCRSFGIPARLEPATYIPQYYWHGKWISVFKSQTESAVEKVPVQLYNVDFTPKYYTSYTIARLIDGRFQTLDYEYDESMNEFPVNMQLEPGTYRIMTGNRQSDGSVLSNWHYLNIPSGSDTSRIALKQQGSAVFPEPIFDFNGDFEMKYLAGDSIVSFRKIQNDFNIISLIDPSTEPGKHFLNELTQSADEFNKLNRIIYLVLPKDKSANSFDAKSWPGLPESVVWLMDSQGKFADQLKTASGKELLFPEVLFISDNSVFYQFSGYHINTAAMLLNAYNRKIY
ncbi:MAG: hypothetical protein A2W93_01410 [Bacteroidetes bacterium GWF2_43_63]|nr:MAG: hypothetical protein A2W94_10660 [Bacteroidetes bacterium GWE2_42_42]OFY55733.1 MAG: hypothetical protein A2W93_01410 [Bacteroidetes bacterium GWF2_43_63]HBG69457.1 hypothetical protein [Bacteroidales bacterium]HCB61377.1 hypothetical protein [Bacteroidales bacterium]HCY24251.1 hypothetical protein [Bacteroidales bacterium]